MRGNKIPNDKELKLRTQKNHLITKTCIKSISDLKMESGQFDSLKHKPDHHVNVSKSGLVGINKQALKHDQLMPRN